MLHQNHILSIVRSYKILLDTSFALEPGFPEFIQNFAPAFRRNPILISALVLWELKNYCQAHAVDPIARSTLELVGLLIRSQFAVISSVSAPKSGAVTESTADFVTECNRGPNAGLREKSDGQTVIQRRTVQV